MSTLREAAIGAMGALETARNGLAWYRDRYPESTDGSDDEAAGDIDAAIDALRAELVKPDAPTVEDEPAPQMPEALRDSLQRRCVEWGVYWRAPDAHGVDLTHEQALELLRDALGVEVEIAAAPRPAPAEPQGAEAPQEIKSLRDRIIEGELELDGTHPPTLMFLMAEHWKAVATEHYAKAKDYDRLKHELRLSRTAPAPRPAGGEPVAALIRHRSLQTEARIAHDGCDHYSDWSDWEPATVQHALAVTDPARNTHPLLWEARLLVDCQPQPAAQQEQAIEHCLWARNGHTRCPQQERKLLTEGQIECHGLGTPERVRFYEHDFYPLSNFSAFNLQWEGFTFQTSEAAYHWEKFACDHDDDTRNGVAYAIYEAPSAHEAFKIAEAQKHLRRADWDAVKVGFMRDILRAKAAQHEYVRRKLLATGDRELVEDSWRDDFWGWGPNQDGQNMLGKLWMEVRAELRAAEPGKGE